MNVYGIKKTFRDCDWNIVTVENTDIFFLNETDAQRRASEYNKVNLEEYVDTYLGEARKDLMMGIAVQIEPFTEQWAMEASDDGWYSVTVKEVIEK